MKIKIIATTCLLLLILLIVANIIVNRPSVFSISKKDTPEILLSKKASTSEIFLWANRRDEPIQLSELRTDRGEYLFVLHSPYSGIKAEDLYILNKRKTGWALLRSITLPENIRHSITYRIGSPRIIISDETTGVPVKTYEQFGTVETLGSYFVRKH